MKKMTLLWKGDKKGMYTVMENVALLEGGAGRIALVKML